MWAFLLSRKSNVYKEEEIMAFVSWVIGVIILICFFVLCYRAKKIMWYLRDISTVFNLLGVKEGILNDKFETFGFRYDENKKILEPRVHNAFSMHDKKVYPEYQDLGELDEYQFKFIKIYGKENFMRIYRNKE